MQKSIYILVLLIIYPFLVSSGKPTGEIVFSRVAFDENKQLETQTSEVFRLVDDLFLKIKLDHPLRKSYQSLNWNYRFDDPNHSYNYALRLHIDGEQMDQWLYELPAVDFRHSTELPFVFQTSNEKLAVRNAYTINNWKNLVGDLPVGLHDISIEFVPVNIFTHEQEAPVLASGSFRLHVIKEEKQSLVNYTNTIAPVPTVINAYLEQEILEASNGVFNQLTPLQVIITDSEADWSYHSDEHGNILNRSLIASVIYKDLVNGNCTVKSGVYFQDHNGYGRFGEVLYLKPATGYLNNLDLPCKTYQTAQTEPID